MAAVTTAVLGASLCGLSSAQADVLGNILVDETGSGLIITPHTSWGSTYISICANADLYGPSPLATALTITAEGMEEYGTGSTHSLTGYATDQGLLSDTHTYTCVNLPLNNANSNVALTYQISAAGALVGGTFPGSCDGTINRVNGSWVTVTPC